MVEKSFLPEFQYKHKNPYHEKLGDFQQFVMRDHEAEAFCGKWKSDVFEAPEEAPLVAEVGTGHGHFMIDYCQKNPDHYFVALDYRFKRAFELAKKLQEHAGNGSPHFRFLRAKGERLHFLFKPSEIDRLFYFFPDPWPKTRHHKKRLFQRPFLELAYQVLKPGATLEVKTDHDGYFAWMQEQILLCTDLFEVEFLSHDLYAEAPEHFLASFQTKFERIFLRQGTKIKAFVLKSKKTL
jgi:tRNA (guanine-N7-)-methyltransferase